jgi:hypothetical protein
MRYFVSFAHSDGFGAAEVYLEAHPRGWEDIELMRRQIMASGKHEQVVILSFQALAVIQSPERVGP